MAKFMYIYHGGKSPESPAEGLKIMAEWNAWFEGMGDAVIDGGGPAGMSKTVSASGVSDNGGANPVSGMSVVEATDQDAAVAMAKDCPMVKDASGTVEVAEVLKM